MSAVYGVERYLEEFIAAVEAQDFPLDRVEVVMVDDGSTDSAPRILAEWQERRPELVRVLTQPNGGTSSARNLGLEAARGEWVSFPDPDDTFAPNYLSEVEAMLVQHPEVAMVATNRILEHHPTGVREAHSLSGHFTTENRVRDLDGHPDFFHGSAPAAFFQHDLLRRTALRFDERIRPSFEDGHFCVSYLLRARRPTVAFVTTAEYYYRKRDDDSSTLARSRTDPERYTSVLEHGYLDVLNQGCQRRGRVPDWLQAFVLHELSWYFSAEESAGTEPTAARGATAESMHASMTRIVRMLEPSVILSASVGPLKLIWREMLLHSYDPDDWHSPFLMVDRLDTSQRLVRAEYRFTGTRPAEEFFSEGRAVEPAYAKTRSVRYFDRDMLYERVVWLPSGALRATLDGARVEVRLDEPPLPRYTMRLWSIRDRLVPEPVAESGRWTLSRAKPKRRIRDRLLLWAAGTSMVRKYFGDAWVLIDRVEDSNDSAELLFRHLRSKHRKVNAWFVLRKGTPDGRRLRRDGYKRIVPYGSLRWKLLMLNCVHLVSSHADTPIVRPAALARLVDAPRWRFSFLGHGVTKDDLSRWLNPKEIDLIVTSTPGEHEAVVADGSPYRYSAREARLTGMPRLDALLREGERIPPERRDLVLLAPTWRRWLMNPAEEGGHHVIDAQSFAATEFARRWLAVIGSPELEAVAGAHGLTVAVLLHPNLQPLRAQLEVPDHVRMLGFEEGAREMFARSRVLVTDYSSMAFDAAYMDRPVVYFQFDRDRMFSGAHSYGKGYFDYRRDGFGPVTETCSEVVGAITETLEAGPHPAEPYARRIRATFPMRDGRCTERVYKAIARSTRRVRPTLVDPQTVERSRPSQ